MRGQHRGFDLYVVGEMVTAAILNTDVRDNLLALGSSDGHGHGSGTAGQGSGDLGPLGTVYFGDSAASPGAGGTLQRNGTHLEIHDGSQVYVVSTVDLAVGTASMRTLGAGATQAADGTHGHA